MDLVERIAGSQLEDQELIASTYAEAIDFNQDQLKTLASLVRLAWFAFVAAPLGSFAIGVAMSYWPDFLTGWLTWIGGR